VLPTVSCSASRPLLALLDSFSSARPLL
jgi:hypothetical protein